MFMGDSAFCSNSAVEEEDQSNPSFSKAVDIPQPPKNLPFQQDHLHENAPLNVAEKSDPWDSWSYEESMSDDS